MEFRSSIDRELIKGIDRHSIMDALSSHDPDIQYTIMIA